MSVIVTKVGEQITLVKGVALTAKHRLDHPDWPKGHLVGNDRINDLIGQTGCDGIRIYYGKDTDDSRQIVLVGVDKDGNDMTSGIIVDRTTPCPAFCATGSELNG